MHKREQRDHLESDDDYRQRLRRFIISDQDRYGYLLTEVSAGNGEALDRVGHWLKLTRRLAPVNLTEALKSGSTEALSVAVLAATTSESANLNRDIIDGLERDVRDLKEKLSEVRAERDAVSRLHAMLGDPRYARRLIAILHSAGPLEDEENH